MGAASRADLSVMVKLYIIYVMRADDMSGITDVKVHVVQEAQDELDN